MPSTTISSDTSTFPIQLNTVSFLDCYNFYLNFSLDITTQPSNDVFENCVPSITDCNFYVNKTNSLLIYVADVFYTFCLQYTDPSFNLITPQEESLVNNSLNIYSF